MRKILKESLLVLGLVMLFAGYVIMMKLFFKAYFSGANQIIININSIGEAHFEAVLLSLSVFVVVPYIIFSVKKIRKVKA